MKKIVFALIAIASPLAFGEVVKCTDQSGNLQYANKADAIRLVQARGWTCSSLHSGALDSNKKAQEVSYREFLKNKAYMKPISAVRLSDLHSYIEQSLPSTVSSRSAAEWLMTFPPHKDGVSIEYPTEIQNGSDGFKKMTVGVESCNNTDETEFIVEKSVFNEKYTGKNSFGATTEVSSRYGTIYCVRDRSYLRAAFLLKLNKGEMNDIAIIARGKLRNGPETKFLNFEPSLSRPIDIAEKRIVFDLEIHEYVLAHKKSGKIISKLTVN